MADLIKTITNQEDFEKAFNDYFRDSAVYLKTSNGNLSITFFGYTGELVAFKIPFLKNMPDQCIIMARKNNATIYAQLQHIEKQEDEVYIFKPIKMQIIVAQRREDRVNVNADGGKQLLYMTGVISDLIIQSSLGLEARKIARIKELVLGEMDNIFARKKIFFSNEGNSDPRMKYFYDNHEPLFVPSLTTPPAAQYMNSYGFYLDSIYSRDYYLLNRKTLVSEISYPVMYNNSIPYGYIQVNHETPLTEAGLDIVRRLALVTQGLVKKSQIFLLSPDRLLVADISKGGMGVAFRDRKYIRYFKEGSTINYKLIFPDGFEAQVTAVVRNIVILDNKIIKVGCELKNIEEEGRRRYLSIIDGHQ